jgi:transcriptional regulator of acetoin/glycerol metabolism
MNHRDDVDRDVDIVRVILNLVAETTPDLTPERRTEIEQAVRLKYGGLRARIAKRKQHPTPEQREKVVQEALAVTNTAVSTDVLADAGGIHRATLYRYLKRRAAG